MRKMSRASSSPYVYEIPYDHRKDLCRLLDLNDHWRDLGGHMEYSVFDILEIESDCRRRGGSPTDSLIKKWGQQNHTILELFVLLSRMKHHPAMSRLKNLVDSRYHCLIDQSCASIVESQRRNTKTSESQAYSSDNNNTSNVPEPVKDIEQGAKANVSDKILNGPPFVNQPSNDHQAKDSTSPMTETIGGLLMIPYKELITATQNWNQRNILGKGGFGVVYKGDWKNTLVAIKHFKNSDNNCGVSDDTLRELRYLNSCRHDNVLPLYGYSISGNEHCLVYQLMSGGSLEARLKYNNSQPPLTWSQRLAIAQGIAKGLQFLHTVTKRPLIHGDIKSANILLDKCENPRIGDFGLARKGPNSDELTHMEVSRIQGTRPYLPDDYLRSHQLSTKVDVYSYGVVLFELITGLSAYDKSRKQVFLKSYVIEYCKMNPADTSGLEDARLVRIGESDPAMSRKLVIVGIKCVQDRAAERPHMVDVWQDLMAIPQSSVCSN